MCPVLIGLLAIVTHTALGSAAGRYAPGRFTAPLYAVVIFWLQSGTFHSWKSPTHNLLPIGDDSGVGSVFYEQQMNFCAPQAVWLVGLTGIALGAVALTRRKTPGAWAALSLAAVIAVVGAVILLRMPGPEEAYKMEKPIPYEPICKESRIPVCVHPAYETVLPETVAPVEDLTRPLVGLPGAPERAEQRRDATPALLKENGKLAFELYGGFDLGNISNGTTFRDYVGGDMSQALVREPPGFGYPNNAQIVVSGWLLWQTDEYDSMGSAVSEAASGMSLPKFEESLKRFDALEPAERRAWFEKNYADLRAGKLTLEDLP